MGFSVYDLLKEAEGDEQEQAAAPADPTAADAPADNQDDAGADDDNFDIDANLDNPDDAGGEDDNMDDAAGGDDFGGETGGGSGDTEEDDEPVEANTDIFASLTSEEQQMKIMELKLQYNNLYSSCNDLIEKVSNLDLDEDSIIFINRITKTLMDLKRYIADYLVYTFAQKSFIENDIMFNRFLSIIQSITVAFDKFQKKTSKDVEDNVKK